MTAPIALQLCSVQPEIEKDFEGTIRRIADIGYLGVELGAPPEGVTYEQAGALFRELDLAVPATFLGRELAFGPSRLAVLESLAALNCNRLVFGNTSFIAKGPFVRMNQIVTTCGCIKEAYYFANQEAGVQVGIHNHAREFEVFGGRPVYRVMLEHLEPGIFFEIDTYWVKTGGYDPAAVIQELGPRVKLLHIKDGPARHGEPTVAIGKGTLDWPPIIGAATDAEWLTVEIEGCETDNMEAVAESYRYLVGNGLAQGSR